MKDTIHLIAMVCSIISPFLFWFIYLTQSFKEYLESIKRR